jgi:hypothetical protein
VVGAVLNSPSRPCDLHALHLQEVPAHVPTFAAPSRHRRIAARSDQRQAWNGVLVGLDGAVAASFPGTAEITVWQGAPGAITITITITVADDMIETLPPGRYSDRLRVTIDGTPDLLWTGCITVGANLFGVRPPDWPAPLPWPLPPGPRPYNRGRRLAAEALKEPTEDATDQVANGAQIGAGCRSLFDRLC